MPMFRDAYRDRRCILPVDGFYEWMATKGGKQPDAIAMKDRSPFGIAGIWENWKNPEGEWVRTFALLTTDANDLVARIHDPPPYSFFGTRLTRQLRRGCSLAETPQFPQLLPSAGTPDSSLV